MYAPVVTPKKMMAQVRSMSQHALQRQRPGIERAAEDRGDVADDQRRGEDVAAGGVVAPLEELRHRVDAAAHVVGQENPDEQRVDDPGVPASSARHDAVLVCRAGVGDQIVGRDVSRDHARADDVPGELPVAEEIALGGLSVPPGDEEAEGDRDHHVQGEDRQVDAAERNRFGHTDPRGDRATAACDRSSTRIAKRPAESLERHGHHVAIVQPHAVAEAEMIGAEKVNMHVARPAMLVVFEMVVLQVDQ